MIEYSVKLFKCLITSLCSHTSILLLGLGCNWSRKSKCQPLREGTEVLAQALKVKI